MGLLLQSCYVTEEASAFLALQSKAKPVASLLRDPKLPAPERDLLERVARIRAFAIGSLGLKDTKNYTSLVELDADRLATVVQACAPLSFDRYLWSYPVVGRLPYKGFFDPKDADKEAARLRQEGYDVLVRGVDAFSTLGWFRDPLYSFMESYSEADLAELIIHEMTHATAFSKSTGDFNEELATFVGRLGAEAYLEAREGTSSASLKEAREGRAEAEAFARFLAGTASELEAVYRAAIPEADKRARKAEVIAARAALWRDSVAPGFKLEGYRSFPMERINNAWLDLYRLYEGEPGLYADYLRTVCSGDLRRFIAEATRLARAKGDPKEAMRRELAAAVKP
jgi:predicted aminopeptidase